MLFRAFVFCFIINVIFLEKVVSNQHHGLASHSNRRMMSSSHGGSNKQPPSRQRRYSYDDYSEDSDYEDDFSSDYSDESDEDHMDEDDFFDDGESEDEYFEDSEDDGYDFRHRTRGKPTHIQRPGMSASSGGGSGITGMLRSSLLKPTDPQKPGLKKTLDSYGETMTSTLSSVVNVGARLKRDMKEYFAGDVEAAMLKVTRPDDYCPDPLTVNSIIGQTRFFVQDEDVTSNSNCYRQMLRKIWGKMAEEDWRTVTKALYLLHKLFRDVGAEDARCFKVLLDKMSREVYDRRTLERCFSISIITKLKSEDHPYTSFVQRYATFVLKRARTFTSGFVELKLVGLNMRPEDVIATLMKAKKAINAALDCMITAEEEAEVSVVCLELLVHDLFDLWVLFHKKLKWVVDQQEDGDLFQAWDEEQVNGLLDQFKKFYLSTFEDIDHFIQENDDLLSLYGFCLPAMDLPTKHQFEISSRKGDDVYDDESHLDSPEEDPIIGHGPESKRHASIESDEEER